LEGFDQRLQANGCSTVKRVQVEEYGPASVVPVSAGCLQLLFCSTTTITDGALSASLQPLLAPNVAERNIGLNYLEERDPIGQKLRRGKVAPALAWFIEKASAAHANSVTIHF
jgi:hypothetical protein